MKRTTVSTVMLITLLLGGCEANAPQAAKDAALAVSTHIVCPESIPSNKCKDLHITSIKKYNVSEADKLNGISESYGIIIEGIGYSKKWGWDNVGHCVPIEKQNGEWIIKKVWSASMCK